MSFTDNTINTRDIPDSYEKISWLYFGLGLLSIRFVQGFIYWGGGARRFIYAPYKLDPSHHPWMANKFQTAMPGALLGTEHLVSYVLQHFWLLYTSTIIFSAAEFFVGLALMIGFLTRLSALISMGFAVFLMLLFGWQGATCIDEWTMAACNLAMGATLLLAGGKAYSVDNFLLTRHPELAQKTWFQLSSGALPLEIISPKTLKTIGLWIFAFVALFDVSTYSHYRGSVISPFHTGPVNPKVHHLSLDHAEIDGQGNVRFHVYLDAGTPEAPVHVVRATLLNEHKKPIFQWNEQSLSALPKSAFLNDYKYNQFGPGPFGFKAPMGAKATITLPCAEGQNCAQGAFISLTDVDGKSFTAQIRK